MNVGIITWYDVLNYGSAFQAYALQESIKEFGHTVEILKHDRILPQYYENRVEDKSLSGLIKWVRNQSPNRRAYRKATNSKHMAFEKFRASHLNIGNHYSSAKLDHVIIGSDQIFDINGVYYSFQFGGNILCSSKSTYAPCFGETTYDELIKSAHYQEIEGNIKSLKVVNARDRNTKTILESITGEKVPIVLDPSLLYMFEREKHIWNTRLIKEAYCIIYTWGGYSVDPKFAACCKKFAQNNHLKLVSIGEPRKWCDIQYSTASPIEFFELFMYADMVITNMFHGTCFSILMERPFYSFVMPHNQNKVGNLLEWLDLEEQMICSLDAFPFDIPVIEYERLIKELEFKRESSRENLQKALLNTKIE